MRIITFISLFIFLCYCSTFSQILTLKTVDNTTGNEIVPDSVVITNLKTKKAKSYINVNVIDLNDVVSVASTSTLKDNMSIYPNPVIDNFNVIIESDKYVNDKIQIFDFFGRKLFSTNIVLNQGINTFSIRMGKQSKGMYFLSTSKFSKSFLYEGFGAVDEILLVSHYNSIIYNESEPSIISIIVYKNGFLTNHQTEIEVSDDLNLDINMFSISSDYSFRKIDYFFKDVFYSITIVVDGEESQYEGYETYKCHEDDMDEPMNHIDNSNLYQNYVKINFKFDLRGEIGLGFDVLFEPIYADNDGIIKINMDGRYIKDNHTNYVCWWIQIGWPLVDSFCDNKFEDEEYVYLEIQLE